MSLDELRVRRVIGALPTPVLSVAKTIAEEHALDLFDVLSKDRSASLVRARDHVLAVVRWSTGLSLPEMGRMFAVDSTTVLEAVRRHDARLNGTLADYRIGRKEGWAISASVTH